MKDSLLIPRKAIRSLFGWMILFLLIVPGMAMSQEDSSSTTATEETTEEVELISPLVEFTSVQKNDQTIDLRASLQAKIEGTLTKLAGLKIEFYSVAGTDTKLGEAITDKNGMAVLNMKADAFTPDTAGRLHFKIMFAGNPTMEAAEEVLAIKRARLELVPVKEDSVLSLQLTLIDMSTGTDIPVPETELAVFVKRLFNPLKIGEGTTDEAGEAIIEIPNDISGDEQGNISLLARVLENEEYGNLETVTVQKWGTPVSMAVADMPRALWSPNPPLWMLVTFIILMGAVWGHYVVIVYKLFRLRKEQ